MVFWDQCTYTFDGTTTNCSAEPIQTSAIMSTTFVSTEDIGNDYSTYTQGGFVTSGNIVSGVMQVTGVPSEITYPFNANVMAPL